MSNASASTSALPTAGASSSAAPLLAFTESAQRRAGGGKKKASAKSSKKGKGKGKEKPKTAKVLSALAEARRTRTQHRRPNKKEALTFDDDARREYLTGFQKRKTERKEAARKVLEERKKKELRESRSAARQERKQRAAENVKAERTALGLDSEDEDEDGEEDGLEAAEVPPAEFESEEQHAVVTVESFDPDDPLGLDDAPKLAAPVPAPRAADKIARKRQKIVDSIPASSRRATKKASRQADGASTAKAAGAKKGGHPKKSGSNGKKTRSSLSQGAAKSSGGHTQTQTTGPGHGAGRLPQRKQAAKVLTDMLSSTSRKAKVVS